MIPKIGAKVILTMLDDPEDPDRSMYITAVGRAANDGSGDLFVMLSPTPQRATPQKPRCLSPGPDEVMVLLEHFNNDVERYMVVSRD